MQDHSPRVLASLSVMLLLLTGATQRAQAAPKEGPGESSTSEVQTSETSDAGAGSETVVEHVVRTVDSVSEAEVFVNGEIRENRVETEGLSHSAHFQASGRANIGIISINQQAGTVGNQANVRSIATSNGSQTLALTSTAVESRVRDNHLEVTGSARSNVIDGAFGETRGIVGMNQSAGHLNMQVNSLALAVGISAEGSPTAVAISDEQLGDMRADNVIVPDEAAPRADVIRDSFSGFRGVAQTTQTSGDLNTLSNNLSISVHVLRGEP